MLFVGSALAEADKVLAVPEPDLQPGRGSSMRCTRRGKYSHPAPVAAFDDRAGRTPLRLRTEQLRYRRW